MKEEVKSSLTQADFTYPIGLFIFTIIFALIVAIARPSERAVCLTAALLSAFLYLAYLVPALLTHKHDIHIFLAATLCPAPFRLGAALLIFWGSLHYFKTDPLELELAVFGIWLPVLCSEIWILCKLAPPESKKEVSDNKE